MKTALEFYVSSIEECEQKFELGLISFEVLKTTKKYWLEKAKEKEKEQMCQFVWDYHNEFLNNGGVMSIEEYYHQTYNQP